MRQGYLPRVGFHNAGSGYIAAEIRRLLPSRMSGRLHVCPMGVDYEDLADAKNSEEERNALLQKLPPAPMEKPTPKNTCLILYAGRLAKEKNLPLLAEVLARL